MDGYSTTRLRVIDQTLPGAPDKTGWPLGAAIIIYASAALWALLYFTLLS